MKTYNRISLFLITALVLLSSCSDSFLDVYPQDIMMSPTYFNTDAEVLSTTSVLYTKPWFEGELNAAMWIGDSRAGVAVNTEPPGLRHLWLNTNTATGQDIEYLWRATYAVNTLSLATKENVEKYCKSAVSQTVKDQAIGECHFMSSIAYFNLVCIYGDVPVIDNIFSSLGKSSRLNTRETVWEYLINEMELAEKLLPSKVDKGRVSKWAAKAYLSRFYLYFASFKSVGGVRDQVYLDKAKVVAKEVIDSKEYALMSDYEDLFKSKNDNNIESIFALQWKYGAGYGYENVFQSYYAFGPSITGVGNGYGAGHGATYYILNKFITRKEKSRCRATYFMNGQEYSYLHQIVQVNGVNTEVPLKYVNTDKGGYHIKKYVVGLASDNNGEVGATGTGNNTYKMRYAEVLLNYAEAILGNNTLTTDVAALDAFNQVRKRAGIAIATEITPATLYEEREMEFTQERILWYEIIKRYYVEPQKTLDFLNDQNRTYSFKVTTINATTFDYTIMSNTDRYISGPNESGSPVNGSRIFLPVPEYEKSMDPGLALEPVPYIVKK